MATLAERIERLSIPEPNSGCWLWLGQVSHLGYGKIMMKKKESAHRMSWEAFRGPIGDHHVLHSCDVRCCVNPDHLFLGTHSDNMLDMYAKGRHRKVFQGGSKHHRSKLSEEAACYIISTPKHTRGLAEKFGVNNSRISSIRKGLTWKHLHPKGT